LRLQGLYAITPAAPQRRRGLTDLVAEALAGGARVVQYRDKGPDERRRRGEAGALLGLCREADALLIVNDDLELAAAVGAHGVHLGRDDADPRAARRRLGRQALIGVSCYDRLERARGAQAVGADYVAFGRFFPSRTKPAAVQARPELLHRARRELRLPLVAIGGITPENGASLIAAGADMLAVVDGVFGAADVRTAARAFSKLFPRRAE
jgi:thiamine-phosphate pyrophosphorylase